MTQSQVLRKVRWATAFRLLSFGKMLEMMRRALPTAIEKLILPDGNVPRLGEVCQDDFYREDFRLEHGRNFHSP